MPSLELQQKEAINVKLAAKQKLIGLELLFEAACQVGNGVDMNTVREDMHTILDVVLDKTSESWYIARSNFFGE